MMSLYDLDGQELTRLFILGKLNSKRKKMKDSWQAQNKADHRKLEASDHEISESEMINDDNLSCYQVIPYPDEESSS